MSDYSDEHDDEREKSEKHSSLAESVINCDYCLPYFRRITKCVFVLHKLHIPKHVKRNFCERKLERLKCMFVFQFQMDIWNKMKFTKTSRPFCKTKFVDHWNYFRFIHCILN